MPYMSFAVRRARPRLGVTLIELLVVMAIIAALASLVIGAVFKLRGSQEKRFTEITISKLISGLDQQWKAVIDQSRDEPLTAGVITIANGDMRRARVIHIKIKLKQSLPNTFADALTQNLDVPMSTTFVQALANGQTTLGTLPPPPANATDWQSSALLYIALNRASRGMAAFNPDDVIDPNFIRTVTLPIPTTTTTYKSFKCFVDVWGTPLRAYTFPYYCDELNAPPYVIPRNPPAPNHNDVQDPEGTLVDPKWDVSGNTNAQAVANLLHPLPFFDAFPKPTQPPFTAHYLIPVIGSAGPDMDFGGAFDKWFFNLSATGNVGQGANDNIYSYRLRQFGQRGDR